MGQNNNLNLKNCSFLLLCSTKIFSTRFQYFSVFRLTKVWFSVFRSKKYSFSVFRFIFCMLCWIFPIFRFHYSIVLNDLWLSTSCFCDICDKGNEFEKTISAVEKKPCVKNEIPNKKIMVHSISVANLQRMKNYGTSNLRS